MIFQFAVATKVDSFRNLKQVAHATGEGTWNVEQGYLFALCDSFGNRPYKRSELAAETIISSFYGDSSRYRRDALMRALASANERIMAEFGAQSGGTTAVVALLVDGLLHVGHVGDSRAYLFHGNQLIRLTYDHSYAETLILSGSVTREEVESAHSIDGPRLTRGLGLTKQVAADWSVQLINPASKIMLCTRDLAIRLSKPDILKTIQTSSINNVCGKLLARIWESTFPPKHATVIIISI